MLAIWPTSWYYDLMPKMHEGRRYDLWWEDPYRYAQQMRDLGESQVYLTFTNVLKNKINPLEWMKMNFHGFPWRCYINDGDTTHLIDYTCKPYEHKGSWPTWSAEKYDLKDLQDLIENPWSERPYNPDIPWYKIPVPGQAHRIFVQDLRAGTDKIDVNRRRRLSKIQRLYPEVELFIRPKFFHMPLLFGCGFTAGCLDPYKARGDRRGAVWMPTGNRVRQPDILDDPRTMERIKYFGFSPKAVATDQIEGLLFTMSSVRYAAHHWDDPTGIFLGRMNANNSWLKPDYRNPDMYAKMPSYENFKHFKNEPIKDSDKILCDSCALWRLCPAYRSEAVCGLPGTESKKLSELAMSRNADDVVEMLASIVSKQAERVETRMDDEQFLESGHDKEVDKMLNNLFKNGTQLAKLRDPNLGRPLVQINANVQPQLNSQVAQADPRALAAQVIQEIEASGVKREDITEQMIEDYMKGQAPTKQLEGEVVDAEFTDE